MELKVVAVMDLAVAAYMRPFYVPHIGLALRSFEDEVLRDGSEMNKHPKDYILCEVAVFDEETGQFTNLDHVKQLVRAVDIVEVRKLKSNGGG